MCCSNLEKIQSICQLSTTKTGSRRWSKTYTRTTVFDWSVRARKLAQVVTRHFGFDFDRVKYLQKKKGNKVNTKPTNNYLPSPPSIISS